MISKERAIDSLLLIVSLCFSFTSLPTTGGIWLLLPEPGSWFSLLPSACSQEGCCDLDDHFGTPDMEMSKPFYWGFHDQFTQQQVESLLLGDGVTAVRSAYCILSGSQNDTITGLIDSD